MATIPQYYDEGGAPLEIGIDPLSVGPTWFAHRDRLTGWLADLPDDAWGGPTRCDGWTVSELVRHLASVLQFEGFTLHQAAKGHATRLLEGMDTQETPGAAAALLGDLDPGALLETMRGFDAQIDTTVDEWSAADWGRTAEAPPGHLPAWMSLCHMLFDSWVHEYDLLLPRDETPAVVANEVEIVVAYVLGLAGVTGEGFDRGGATAEVRVTDCDLRIGLDARGDRAIVRPGWAPDQAPVVEGTAGALLDVATGRDEPAAVSGDPAGVAVLVDLARLLR